MVSEPFDRELPSPIGTVLELAASAPDAVVVIIRGGEQQALSPVQQRMEVDTGVEQALIGELDREPAAAVILSGSAGGGKTLLLKRLADRYPDRFGRVVEDATHAETPDQTQTDALVDVFSDLADAAGPHNGPPALVAMNTGMVIRFFDGLRVERGPDHGFTALEHELKQRLLLRPPAQPPSAVLPGRILVVNLDGRPTAGGPGSLLHEMLGKLEPDSPDGIMDGAERCRTCSVRAHCFVRTNAELLSSEPARSVVSRAGEQIALLRGRPLQPRAAWDLIHQLLTGGDRFAHADPCDRIAELAQDSAGARTVWKRLACNGVFGGDDPRGDGQSPAEDATFRPAYGAAADLRETDPSFAPSEAVHELLSTAGVDPEEDASRLQRLLGADTGREAIETAAAALRTRPDDGDYRELIERGRGLVRAAALAGHHGSFELPATEPFRAALEDYRRTDDSGGSADAASDLADLVEECLTRAFGERVRGESYFLIEAFDPRRTFDALVHVDLRDPSLLRMTTPDPAIAQNPDGARVVGYQPLAVLLCLRDVELRVDLPLYRLLRLIKAGAVASTADLEGFYHLRRAAEALGRLACDHDRSLLIRDRSTGSRYLLATRTDRRGRNRLGLEAIY
jgi:hypothetical protein